MRLSLGRGLALAVVAVVLAWAAATPAARADPTFPPLSGRVVDAANILPPETEAQLTTRLEQLQTRTGRQLVVATVPSLQGYDISDYGYRLGRAWGIGSAARDDGALLIVAPSERKVRVEVGRGLEGVLTDAFTSRVLRDSVVPRFRANDIPGGVVAGADALIAQLVADPDLAQRNVQAANAAKPAGRGGSIWPIVLTILIVWLVLFLLGRGRGRSGGLGGVLPGVIIGSGLGRGGGGWSGGGWSGGGGGGFSGGGGSFGGGGSSSGW